MKKKKLKKRIENLEKRVHILETNPNYYWVNPGRRNGKYTEWYEKSNDKVKDWNTVTCCETEDVFRKIWNDKGGK